MPSTRILIQIASYRDPQLGPTLEDLIAKAANPQQLRIGICLQITPDDAARCGPASLPQGDALRGAQLDLDLVDARSSGGVCWARARSQRFLQQEAFTLQIDSHMRFAKQWDQQLLASWQRCNDPLAVISGYPNAFTLPDYCNTDALPLMAAHRFDEHGILRLQGVNTFRYPEQQPAQPLPSAVLAAGMLFGPSALIGAAPYDPQLYFYGEELSLTLRLWTRGFNFYNPDRLLIFHLYKQAGAENITHWADHANWSERNRLSAQRLQALIHGDGLEPPYGLGTARSLEQWQQWSGINLHSQTLSPEALAGRFTAPPTSAAAAAG